MLMHIDENPAQYLVNLLEMLHVAPTVSDVALSNTVL